ncbi:MAG: hypothetical protein WCS86_02095 [Candidatus Paceibacterota bacterium]
MENDNKLRNKNIETYTDDMVKAIESDKGGLIKKIIHEEEQHEAEKKNLSPGSKRNRLFMLISIALIFLAVVVLAFFVFINNNINTVSIAPQASSIIFTDRTDFKAIDGQNKDKISAIVFDEANNTKVKIGGVEGIYLTEANKVIGFKRLNALLKGNLNNDQLSLISDNFLLGTFKSGVSSISPNIGELFMLLKVRSFPEIFPVMRSWETKMFLDLHGFFGVGITPETNYLLTKSFEDGIVKNKNARILRDNDGKIVLMYVFIDDSSIIITNFEAATGEVILRLASSQIKK